MYYQPELFNCDYPVIVFTKQKRIRRKVIRQEIQQPELFDLTDPDNFIKSHKPKRVRKPVDYEALYELFLRGPVRFKDIEEAAGVSHNAVAQVITTLSLRYPIYELKRGLYKLYGPEEYGDGIKRSLLQDEEI